MSEWRPTTLDVVAFVSGVLDDGGDELLEQALDGLMVDLGAADEHDLVVGFTSLVVSLLGRLAGVTGRDRDELWQEIARGLSTGIARKGSQDD